MKIGSVPNSYIYFIEYFRKVKQELLKNIQKEMNTYIFKEYVTEYLPAIIKSSGPPNNAFLIC